MVPDSMRLAARRRRRSLWWAIAASLTLIAVLVAWDTARLSALRVEQQAHRHHLVAFALALDIADRLASLPDSDDGAESVLRDRERLLARAVQDAARLEREGEMLVLLHYPDRAGFLRTNGSVLASATLQAALDAGDDSRVLTADQAKAIGLPADTAVVGLAKVADAWRGRALGLAVASSASDERARFRHGIWRNVLGMSAAALAVLLLGVAALREQRRELALVAKLERERLERARDEQLSRAERMATLAALSTGIAHELATPLGVIAGRAEQLRAHAATEPKATRALGAIEAQVQRMRAVMEGFLALARGQRRALSVVSAAALAREAEELVRFRFDKAEVALQVDVAAGRAVGIACDAPLFVQVLVNLLENACQASRAGDTVQLRLERHADRLRFCVLDRGQGLDPEVRQRVTEPFFTTRTTQGGSGLGLAIAKEIVAQHDGVLALESREDGGCGTVARVELGVVELAEDDTARVVEGDVS